MEPLKYIYNSLEAFRIKRLIVEEEKSIHNVHHNVPLYIYLSDCLMLLSSIRL